MRKDAVREPVTSQGTSTVQSIDVSGVKTILIVEDDISVRRLVCRTLENAGYNVLHAACGKEAIEIFDCFRQPIHLLITDIVMPQMDGRLLAERLRSNHPDLKILFMTGYSYDILDHNRKVQNCFPLLHKPFTLGTLCTEVRNILKK